MVSRPFVSGVAGMYWVIVPHVCVGEAASAPAAPSAEIEPARSVAVSKGRSLSMLNIGLSFGFATSDAEAIAGRVAQDLAPARCAARLPAGWTGIGRSA